MIVDAFDRPRPDRRTDAQAAIDHADAVLARYDARVARILRGENPDTEADRQAAWLAQRWGRRGLERHRQYAVFR